MPVRPLLLLIGALVAACSVVQPGERPELGVENGTDLVVVLTVNGQEVGEFPPGGPAPEINVGMLAPLPWVVEARTITGRLLVSMEVRPGAVFRENLPNGGFNLHGPMGRVDLSCGRLTIYAGEMAPSGPAPGPNPGVPGDCIP